MLDQERGEVEGLASADPPGFAFVEPGVDAPAAAGVLDEDDVGLGAVVDGPSVYSCLDACPFGQLVWPR